MPRTNESLQTIWQAKFQEYQLNPFAPSRIHNITATYYPLNKPSSWWYNPINPDSLRLTRFSFQMISKQKKIKNWKFKTNVILPKTLLKMEKYFTSQYFIGPNSKSIYVYDERDAMMLGLHANNLEQYIDNQF